MRVLVIPDCHLKPWMFEKAIEIKERMKVDRMVFLGDLIDDWHKQFDIELYEETLDSLINTVKKYPDTLICYGNHDYGYLHNFPHSGYSSFVNTLVIAKYKELMSIANIKVIHKIDNVLFSHAGLCERYMKDLFKLTGAEVIEEVLDLVNNLPPEKLWNDYSPIWFRPQYNNLRMYAEDNYIQVIGHTPTKDITMDRSYISCDVFSTYSDGRPIGNRQFIIIDSNTGDFCKIVNY